jgi:DNA-binding NtrC family response regulator
MAFTDPAPNLVLITLGKALGDAYGDVASAPLPGRLRTLIDALERAQPRSRQGEGRQALVVEDDDNVRDLAATVIEETDLEAVDFPDAESALAYLGEHASTTAMIFADVRLPGRLDGVDLASEVARRWPWIHVLVTSGAPGDRVAALPPGASYIAKPWRALDVLVHAERAICAKAAER